MSGGENSLRATRKEFEGGGPSLEFISKSPGKYTRTTDQCFSSSISWDRGKKEGGRSSGGR